MDVEKDELEALELLEAQERQEHEVYDSASTGSMKHIINVHKLLAGRILKLINRVDGLEHELEAAKHRIETLEFDAECNGIASARAE